MSNSELKDLEKRVNGDLRTAQNKMFSGKNDEAWNMIEEIWTDIEKIRAIDPNYRSIQNMERTYNKLKQDLERKLGKVQAPDASHARSQSSPPISRSPTQRTSVQVTSKEVDLKLPAGVTKRLRDILTPIQRVESYIDEEDRIKNLEKAKYELQSATAIHEEIERMYSDYVNHVDVQALYRKIMELDEKLNILTEEAEQEKLRAQEKQDQMETESKEWILKIRPYLIGGGVYDKQLALSRIRDKENFIRQSQLLNESKMLLNEYNSHDWSNGKTWELEQAEESLNKMIVESEKTYRESIKSIISEVDSLIEEKITWFLSDTAWKTDITKRPVWLYTRDKQEIEEKMASVEDLVPEIIPENNKDLALLNDKLTRLLELNQERLDIIPKRTYMLPEKYTGEDRETLKSKAAELVKQKEPTAEILKVHLIREDWRVEDVIEHTDTSRTSIRHRITYHLPAQVAVRLAEKTLLYNVHIAKNQRPDEAFDSLYGNLEDHPDNIALENIS